MTDILKLSGNMVSISTKPEDAGHAEFARDTLAHNNRLEAINADLLAALEDVMVYMEHNNIAQFADRQGSIEQIAYRNARAAIAKAKGQ